MVVIFVSPVFQSTIGSYFSKSLSSWGSLLAWRKKLNYFYYHYVNGYYLICNKCQMNFMQSFYFENFIRI